MPNFKPKANKKIKMNKKSIVTLDSKHQEKINELKKIKNKKIHIQIFDQISACLLLINLHI